MKMNLTRGFSTILDEEDFNIVKNYRWRALGKNAVYAARNYKDIDGVNKTILLSRFIMNASQGVEVDHINGDKLDNRRENLRICTHAENSKNKEAGWGISKYKGCSPKGKKWMSYICVNKKHIYLGIYITEEEAANAYNDAAIKYHGEFARLNFL